MIIQATYNFDSALLYSAIVMSSILSGAVLPADHAGRELVIRWQPEDTHH